MSVGWGLRILRLFGHQHWIPRGRDRVLRTLVPPDKAPPHRFVVPYFGMRYQGSLDNLLDWRVFFYGANSPWELLLLRAVAPLVRRDGRLTFMDVGANIGLHTLFMSAVADRVIAFEPYEPVRRRMVETLSFNAVSNVDIHPVALGNGDATADYHEPAGANTGTGSLLAHHPGLRTGQVLSVPVVHGDSYFARHALPRIDVLKIDVEGYEAPVLHGLRNRLDADRPIILMELSDTSRPLFGGADGLKHALYTDHCIVGVKTRSISGSFRLTPFDFDRDDEILIFPKELQSALAAAVRCRVPQPA